MSLYAYTYIHSSCPGPWVKRGSTPSAATVSPRPWVGVDPPKNAAATELSPQEGVNHTESSFLISRLGAELEMSGKPHFKKKKI